MHNFELNEDLEMIVGTVRRFVDEQAGPAALEHDEHRQFVRASFEGLADLGVFGLPIAEVAGGAGLGLVAFAAAIEPIAAGCGSTARLLVGQTGGCATALAALATPDDACAALSAGETLGAWVGPEHGVRSDGGALTGEAVLVTAAGEAELLVVAARDADGKASLWKVEAADVQREPVPALGFRACAPARVRFTKSAATRLAEGGAAEAAIRRAQIATWIGDAALAVGLARASFELSRRHAHDRIAFGKPLFHQQAVAHKLVESMRRAEAARHLAWHAARLADGGADAADAARMAKLEAVTAAVHAGDEGIQIHGGFGYTVEYHVERHYRDAMALTVLDGGAEQLRDQLAKSIAL